METEKIKVKKLKDQEKDPDEYSGTETINNKWNE